MSWGSRKVTDSVIRAINAKIKTIPTGEKKKAFQDIAREFKCSVSIVERISWGRLTPRDTEVPRV